MTEMLKANLEGFTEAEILTHMEDLVSYLRRCIEQERTAGLLGEDGTRNIRDFHLLCACLSDISRQYVAMMETRA